jgi:putative ABC transport system permease protein
MFWNNVKISLRNLKKNKLFALINIIGLALGLTIYVFAGLLADYERSHDLFFKNASRIYTVGTVVNPEAGLGINEIDSAHTALGPIIDAEFEAVEMTARSLRREYLVTMGEDSFYQPVRFVDSTLLDMFDFSYVSGDSSALEDPAGLVISESIARKYFGDQDPMGKVITLDNEHSLYVTAVIEDVARNSHFSSSFINNSPFDVVAPFQALSRIEDYDVAGEWTNLSVNDLTYVLLPDHLGADWLSQQVAGIYDRHVPEETKDIVSGFKVRRLQDANLAIWDTFGLPVISIIKLLGLLVLVVACVNYTNLATAQSLGRSREVGMRKTMGAGQWQLLTQFLTESLTIAAISMLVAIAALELVIPLFNNAANKVLALDYLATLPWLVLTTALVGLLAGSYPAYLITRARPIDALRDTARKGKKGSTFRAIMIATQFAISVFMLAVVAVVHMQNQKAEEASQIFPKSEIYTLSRLNVESIQDRLEVLQSELTNLPNVESVAFSSQVPFEQNNSSMTVSPVAGDEASELSVHLLRMSPEFLATYGIKLLAGRQLSKGIGNDEWKEESEVLNVLVNELALERLGLGSPEQALNKVFYDTDDEDAMREYVVVGVVPSQNILGLHNEVKPFVYFYSPEDFRVGSIRISGGNMIATVDEIEKIWKTVIPDYPIQGRFLDDTFEEIYSIYRAMNLALTGFTLVALMLALIGLFGLAAFMAAQRTKEIGVRKVLGASSLQIARLLVWQFSKPVMWALIVALPGAFFASSAYLGFFADRIDPPIGILAVAGIIAVLFAWGTVAIHAVRISRANPILALRYE